MQGIWYLEGMNVGGIRQKFLMLLDFILPNTKVEKGLYLIYTRKKKKKERKEGKIG